MKEAQDFLDEEVEIVWYTLKATDEMLEKLDGEAIHPLIEFII